MTAPQTRTRVQVECITVPQSDYDEATESYQGWCPACAAFTREHTEPDAEGYDCPECEGRSVVGAEQALLLGWIDLGDES